MTQVSFVGKPGGGSTPTAASSDVVSYRLRARIAGRPTGGWLAFRIVAVILLLLFVFALPAIDDKLAAPALQAAEYAMVGIGLNVLVGYTGQLSLGQFAFVALGAMTAANVTNTGVNAAEPIHFALGLAAAALVGAGTAVLLGAVALRLSGLYLALVTLVFGQVAIDAVLGIPSLNGNDAGIKTLRPPGLAGEYSIYLVALALALTVFYLDRRIAASSAGRAMVTLRENERVAQAFGINVVATKLLAFAFAGGVAALAGGISVYGTQEFSNKNYTTPYLTTTLTFVVMVVVGGLGSRAGVLVASVFFGVSDALFAFIFKFFGLTEFYTDHKAYVTPLLGAVLLLITVIQRPGGLGEIATPIGRWMTGGPFHSAADDAAGGGVVEGSSVRA